LADDGGDLVSREEKPAGDGITSFLGELGPVGVIGEPVPQVVLLVAVEEKMPELVGDGEVLPLGVGRGRVEDDVFVGERHAVAPSVVPSSLPQGGDASKSQAELARRGSLWV
jgi:hypothetical protein